MLVLRNELNEHIRPGMLVWGVSKFSAEKKMKEQPSFYAFFIRKMVAPTGDPQGDRRGRRVAARATPSSTCGDSKRRT